MLPKKNRANKKDVDIVFKNGSFINSTSLTFKFLIKIGNKEPKISFVCPKGVSKKAVIRNKLRRLGYLALSKHLLSFPVETIGLFIFKKYEDNSVIIENEIKNILHKIN